jgi:hypothetical protein
MVAERLFHIARSPPKSNLQAKAWAADFGIFWSAANLVMVGAPVKQR